MPTAATFAPPTADRYVTELRAGTRLTARQYQLLRMHYHSFERTATAQQLAQLITSLRRGSDTISVDLRKAEPGCTDGYKTMILRLSQNLNAKIKAGSLQAMPLDDNPYADWSCHLFTADRTRYILVSNTKSLYSCVLYGKGITNDSVFIERVLCSLREFMEDDGQSFSYRKFVAPASATVSFAKALNRSVTGSMNDLIGHAVAWLEDGDVAPHDLGFRLNDILLSALATSPLEKYGKPNEAFKLLANTHRPRVV